ncbi:MAG: prepilin-type N-terminal cleavage/methylation domain-containing protein, partial [Candidatus Absconditabacteria bacterium]
MAIKLKRFLRLFTLIELIIVIAIIAVLGASAFLMLSQWMSKSRDSRRVSDLRTLEKTIHISFVAKEGVNYPDPDPKIGVTIGTGVDSYGILWYQGKFGEKMTNFVGNLNKIPKDPKGNYYDYSLTEDKKFYQLLAIMENDKQVSLGVGKVYGEELEITYILTNYEGYIVKKIGADKYYLIKTETIMVDPTKLEDYSQEEYEMDVENDVLKVDAPYSERVEVATGDISGLLSEDPTEKQSAMDTIEEIFPELSNTNVVQEIVQKVGATSNIQVNNTNECTAHEYNGYNFDVINHGESQTKAKTESITDGTKTYELSATCNNGEVTYGEEQISISCEGGKVEQSGSCVSDICQGTLPTNAQLNGTQGVSGTWGYNQTEGLCNFICNEGYNYDNGTSCELNTYTVSGSLTNGDGAIVNVCGSNVTAGPTGAFSATINHGIECDNISVTRSGYTCTISTQGPSSLVSNVTNIAGNCVTSRDCKYYFSSTSSVGLYYYMYDPGWSVELARRNGTIILNTLYPSQPKSNEWINGTSIYKVGI